MKKFTEVVAASLLAVFAIAFLVVPMPAQAQLGNPATTTAAINGTVTSNGVATASLAQSTVASVQLTSVSSAANTSNTVVSIDQRVGAGSWVSTGKTMTIANTGTTAVNCVSNWTGLADAEWRLNVQNGALDGVTNTVTLRIAIKPGK
jgi:hypothetical protein